MSETAAVKTDAETIKVNEKKWTKDLLAGGWTVLPSIFFEKQHALGLDPIDINIIGHLSIYWWEKANLPHPSVATIAAAINVKPRTVQKHIKAMEDLGFMTRIERRQKGQGSAQCAPRAIVDLEFELIICIVVLLWRMKGGQTLEAQAPEEPPFCWN